MMKDQWNSLRVGDAVNVHGDDGGLVVGTVAFVTSEEASGNPNAIGIRVADDDETYYVWPSLADVHAEPVDLTEACVHCRLLHAEAAS